MTRAESDEIVNSQAIATSQKSATDRHEQAGTDLPARLGEQFRRRADWLEALIIALFALLTAVGILHHELWRDETQAWLLARDSESVGALFRNSHHEGHPLLWHYCLHGLSRLSRHPLMMQGFNWLLAVGSVGLLVKKSPFPLLQRGLMAFGYFTLYEYALLSRSYGLGVFLAFLFCALYCHRRAVSRPIAWGMTAALALLANTSLLGLMMSGALAIAFYARLAFSSNGRIAIARHLAALLLAWGLAAFQIGRGLLNPMGLAGFSAGKQTAESAANSAASSVVSNGAINGASAPPAALENLDKLLQIILKSYAPLPETGVHFWNGHLLAGQILAPGIGPFALLLSVLLAGAALLVAFNLLKETPLLLGVYAFGTGSMMAFFILVHRGSTRHYGQLFIFFLACLWLARWTQRGLPPARLIRLRLLARRRLSNAVFTALLCVQVFAGFHAYLADIRLPFSASASAAKTIRARQLETLPLFGLNQRPVSPVSSYLDRQIYYPEAGEYGSFWDISYPKIVDARAVTEAVKAYGLVQDRFVAILTEPLAIETLRAASDLKVEPIANDVGPTIVEDETLYLYEIWQ